MANEYRENIFPKKCACGKVHSEDGWKELKLVGIQKDAAGLSAGEMRDCICGSTLIAMFKKEV